MDPSHIRASQEKTAMVTEEGIVERTINEKAVILIQRSSCCTHCSSQGACDVMNDREMRVEVMNELSATVGDRVEISLPARSLLKLSLLVYFFPIVALVAGAYASGVWAASLGIQTSLASILGGGAAMGLTFYAVRHLDRLAQIKGQYDPRMRRILLSSQTPPSDGNK
jgi:sigma-E factor negative regulatory protein RseC